MMVIIQSPLLWHHLQGPLKAHRLFSISRDVIDVPLSPVCAIYPDPRFLETEAMTSGP